MMWLHVVLIALWCSTAVLSGEVQISTDGIDFPDCGTKDHLCKSIEYAYTNVAKDGDTLYLKKSADGIAYNISRTILMDKSVAVVGEPGKDKVKITWTGATKVKALEKQDDFSKSNFGINKRSNFMSKLKETEVSEDASISNNNDNMKDD